MPAKGNAAPNAASPADAADGQKVDWRKVFAAGGWGAPILVLVLGWVVTQFLWTPLSWPARLLNGMLSTVIEAFAGDGAVTTCSRFARGSTELEWCAAGVGAFTVIGPLFVIIILFVFRHHVRKALSTITPGVPEDFRYLVAPTVAVIVFTMAWAAVHDQTAANVGIVSNQAFPIFIGIFTYVTVQYGKDIHGKMVPTLEKRDKIKVWIRFILTFAIPLLLAILLTRQDRVTDAATKEQLIVIVAVVAGWLLIAPRMDQKGAAALNEAVESAAAKTHRKPRGEDT